MLSVDLHKTDSAHRNKFNEYLSEKNWTKVEMLTTVWTVKIRDDIPSPKVIELVKKRVAAAAEKAEVNQFDAGIMIGDHELITWTHKD